MINTEQIHIQLQTADNGDNGEQQHHEVSKKQINFDKIPGDFKLAQDHLKATRVGPDKPMSEEEKKQGKINEKCDCCARDVDREVLKWGTDIKKFSYLGSGFPMFFQFLKLCITFLAILFLISGIYNMAANRYNGEQCAKRGTECKGNWITEYSIGNRMDSFYSVYIQESLNLSSVCVLIVFVQILIYMQRRLDSDCDDKAILPSDYSIIVENIPKEVVCETPEQRQTFDYDDELKKFFQNPNNMAGRQYKVAKVNLGYELKDLKDLEAKQELFTKKKKVIFTRQIKENGKYDVMSKEAQEEDRHIESIERDILNLEKKLRDGKGVDFMMQYFTGVAFVTFETERMQKDVLELADLSKNIFSSEKISDFFGNSLSISPAPDPTEIFWENLGVSKFSRLIRVIVGFSIDCFMIFCCGIAIYFLSKYQSDYAADHDITKIKDEDEKNRQLRIIQVISFCISIVITAINIILSNLVRKVAELKKLQTRTNYNLSFAFFLSLAQFTNATLVPLIVQIIVKRSTNYQMLYGPSGLIPNQNTIFMVNAFLPVLFFFLDFGSILKKVFRSKQLKNQEKSILTQQELITLFEDPAFTIEFEYSQTMKTMFMTLFYATPLPICILWSMAGLSIQYFISKYNLVYRRSVPFNMGNSLNYNMIQLLKIGLCIYACLSYVFITLSKDDDDDSEWAVSFVAIGIAGLHFFLPINYINQKLFKVKSKKEENTKTYWQVQGDFSNDYDRVNPATKRQANAMFVEEQEGLGNHQGTTTHKALPAAENNLQFKQESKPHQVDTPQHRSNNNNNNNIDIQTGFEESEQIKQILAYAEQEEKNANNKITENKFNRNQQYIEVLIERKKDILLENVENPSLSKISHAIQVLQKLNYDYENDGKENFGDDVLELKDLQKWTVNNFIVQKMMQYK